MIRLRVISPQNILMMSEKTIPTKAAYKNTPCLDKYEQGEYVVALSDIFDIRLSAV